MKLDTIYDEWLDCRRCGLGASRGSAPVCVGNGPTNNPTYLLVMDSPTIPDEASGGYLLGGDFSDLLKELLQAAGIPQEQVFVTGVVGCRPYTQVPATENDPAHEVDRIPDKAEITACAQRVTDIIYRTDPRIIVAMGDVAWRALVSTKAREKEGKRDIASACGSLFEAVIPGVRGVELRYPVLASYSLRQINNNPNSATHGPLHATILSLARARSYVEWVLRKEIALP